MEVAPKSDNKEFKSFRVNWYEYNQNKVEYQVQIILYILYKNEDDG